MDKKGQINLGVIITLFVAILVGAVLLVPVAQEVGRGVNTALINISTGTNADRILIPADGAYADMVGQELIGSATIVLSNGTALPTSNYTVTEGVSTSTGVKTIRFGATNASLFTGEAVNASYEYGPDGYIDSGGGRAIAGLITLFFALAIAIVALSPTLRDSLLSSMGK